MEAASNGSSKPVKKCSLVRAFADNIVETLRKLQAKNACLGPVVQS